jgi:GNAT superfamily N-acetyltransferase
MSDYALVPVMERASIDDYLNLFGQCFGADGKFSSEYLIWQYLTNPNGRVIGFDAYKGHELAAHYAIIPRRYHLGGQVFNAALSLNTATHPSHQGKGLFVQLAQCTYEAAQQLRVQFVIGAANGNSIGGFTRRLGFSELGQVRLKIGWRSSISSENELDLSINSEWLGWRFSNPSRVYEFIEHSDGTSTIRTWVQKVPFNICRVSTVMLNGAYISNRIGKGHALLPALSPVFGVDLGAGLLLPQKLQPSPWHVIWRSLDPACDSELAQYLKFDGLSMDTF